MKELFKKVGPPLNPLKTALLCPVASHTQTPTHQIPKHHSTQTIFTLSWNKNAHKYPTPTPSIPLSLCPVTDKLNRSQPHPSLQNPISFLPQTLRVTISAPDPTWSTDRWDAACHCTGYKFSPSGQHDSRSKRKQWACKKYWGLGNKETGWLLTSTTPTPPKEKQQQLIMKAT